MNNRPTLHFVLLSALFFSLSIQAGRAQAVATASIVGAVRDPGGAYVPGVEITVTSEDRGTSRTAISGDAGMYVVTNLLPGSYEVAAELSGFKRAVLTGITLQVAQEARIDITLQLGDITEVVSVTGRAPVVETEKAAIGSVVTERAILDLPLNGRNFMELTTLTGGTTRGQGSSSQNRGITAKPLNPSVAGQAKANNAYYLDGVQNMDQMWRTYNVAPPVDAIQEFRMQVGQYSAEFGGGGGAIVNVVTKSGTNDFHGSLYEFHRNDNLDAVNFFARSKSQLVFNQFGGSLGGPIIKDRTFFFVTYEGFRERRGLTGRETVPTAEQKAGNLSAFGKTILDPMTGEPFPSGVIPQNRIDPISTRIMEFYPAPNAPGTDNFQRSPTRTFDHDNLLFRVDHELSENHDLTGRFALQDIRRFTPGTNPKVGGINFPQLFHNTMVGLTSNFSTNFINEFRFGLNRTENDAMSQNEGIGIGNTLGLPFPAEPPGDRFPSISFSRTSVDRLRPANPRVTRVTDFHFSEAITYVHGNHIIKTGGAFKRVHDAYAFRGTHTNGTYTFSGQFTGDGFADFLLGIPATMILPITPNPQAFYTQTGFSVYLADDWRVSPRLTVSLGLRYEFESFPREASGFTPKFDAELGGLRYPDQNTTAEPFYTNQRPDLPWGFLDRETAMFPDKNNFAPRIGFAFRPFANTSTVIRGGYGWFYNLTEIINLMNNVTSAPPSTTWGTFRSEVDVPTLSYGGPSDLSGAATDFLRRSTFGFPGTPLQDRFLNGYTQQWSLSISRELSSDLVLQAQYLGSKSTHLENSFDINYAPAGPGSLATRVPFPKWNRLFGFAAGGNANYNSMILSAEQRFSKGLSFKAAYTWGKSLASRGSRTISSHIGLIQNPGDLKGEVNHSPDDVKHRLTFYSVYELPFGRNWKGLAGMLFGGWRLSNIFTYRSGFPLTAGWINGANCNSSFFNRCYPDRLRDPNMGGNGVERPAFDITAYDWPRNPAHPRQPPRFGNAGQNFLRGNSLHLWDLGLSKRIAVTESMTLEFRFESFNAANHPNFSGPRNDPDANRFGRSISTSTNPRELQFGLKLLW